MASKPKVPSSAVADEAAARAFDKLRWESFVRLRCVEIAATYGATRVDSSGLGVIGLADAFAKFVNNAG